MKETKNTICGENPIKILLEVKVGLYPYSDDLFFFVFQLIDGIGFRLKSYKLHYSQVW